ncbi:MAG: ATP-dependent zinc metalloprotease FtsH [Holophaga sp.]|nr:ATP-dependent zinc metalloprotease FtsH [Holophaga sp.]
MAGKEGDMKPFQTKDGKDQGKSGLGQHDPLFKPLNRQQFHFSIGYFLVMLMAFILFNAWFQAPKAESIDYSAFKAKIQSGEFHRVELGEKELTGSAWTKSQLDSAQASKKKPAEYPKDYRTRRIADPGLVQLMDQKSVEYFSPATESGDWLASILPWVFPILLMVVFWKFISKQVGKAGQGVMSFGANKAKLVAEGDTGVTFQDVAGVDEAKAELMEIVDFLKQPKKYEAIGGKIPKGVLLVGPPGTGKTMLAKAVAGEAKVPFFKISGADFVEMFVGVGAARVRDMFKQATEKAPCIIFIDELDAIGKSRGITFGGNDEREQTLNQLLVEMDGFDARAGVIILAATNRPEILDPALLRPGRFDRQVLVDRPDLKGRGDILKIHAKGVSMDDSIDLNQVARETPGFSGADLANIVNEAALLAVRAGRNRVLPKDFDDAIERVVAGLERKNRLINAKERKIVAYHETGHAVLAACTKGADPVHKISIIPRGIGSLGYTIQVPTEDRFLLTREELLAKIDVLLGGRASEQLFFGEVSTGAANDITRATEIARKMICDYGMSEKFENVVLSSQMSPMSIPGEMAPRQREYSESTQQYIDEQITGIIKGRYEKAKAFLDGKKGAIDKIATRLLEVESIGEEEFQALLVTQPLKPEALPSPGGSPS